MPGSTASTGGAPAGRETAGSGRSVSPASCPWVPDAAKDTTPDLRSLKEHADRIRPAPLCWTTGLYDPGSLVLGG